MECSCCQCEAKYEVEGEYACGRHLAYVVDSVIRMPPHSAKVYKIEKQALKQAEQE